MVKHSGAPDAGNLHVRCDEGKGARPRASFLLYRSLREFSSLLPAQRTKDQHVLYAVLIYDDEAEINALHKDKMDELIRRHEVVQAKLAAENKLGPVVRLMPTSDARTLKQGAETLITDGPFAETK